MVPLSSLFPFHSLQIDWAGCAVATLRSEGACVSSAARGDGPFQDLLAFTNLALDNLDEMLMFYATKAMELPPVPDVGPETPSTFFVNLRHIVLMSFCIGLHMSRTYILCSCTIMRGRFL